MLIGPPGCGKSTWAQERIECIHFETDHLYLRRRRPVYVTMAIAIVRAFDRGAETVIADGTHSTGFYRAATLAAVAEINREGRGVEAHAHVWGNYLEAKRRNDEREVGKVPFAAWAKMHYELTREVIEEDGTLLLDPTPFASVTVEA